MTPTRASWRQHTSHGVVGSEADGSHELDAALADDVDVATGADPRIGRRAGFPSPFRHRGARVAASVAACVVRRLIPRR